MVELIPFVMLELVLLALFGWLTLTRSVNAALHQTKAEDRHDARRYRRSSDSSITPKAN